MIPDVTAWNCRLLDINNAPTSTKGLITEVTAPNFERDFDTTKRAGEMGIIPRPRHFNEMEVSFTVKKISKALARALLEAIGTVNKTVSLQCTAIVDTDASTREVYLWTAKGYMSSAPLGNLSADGIDAEFTLMLTTLDLSFGDFTLTYDPANYIYAINGVNLWANIKTQIGV